MKGKKNKKKPFNNIFIRHNLAQKLLDVIAKRLNLETLDGKKTTKQKLIPASDMGIIFNPNPNLKIDSQIQSQSQSNLILSSPSQESKTISVRSSQEKEIC